MTGPDVRIVRRKFGLLPDGKFDRTCYQLVSALAKKKKLDSDGEVNEAVAKELGPSADEHLPPEWFTRDLHHLDMGEDVRNLNAALGLDPGDDRFREDTEAAVRRLQSARGLPPTGHVDSDLARVIGEAR
jgi:peptidoglycan hydrolase-like protein with peptidoglycan-binding domain